MSSSQRGLSPEVACFDIESEPSSSRRPSITIRLAHDDANDLLLRANKALSEHQLQLAHDLYTRVLHRYSHGNPFALLNRSLVYLSFGFPELAAYDAHLALSVASHIDDRSFFMANNDRIREFYRFLHLTKEAEKHLEPWTMFSPTPSYNSSSLRGILGSSLARLQIDASVPIQRKFPSDQRIRSLCEEIELKALYRLAIALWHCGGGQLMDAGTICEKGFSLSKHQERSDFCILSNCILATITTRLTEEVAQKEILMRTGLFQDKSKPQTTFELSGIRGVMKTHLTRVKKTLYPWNRFEPDRTSFDLEHLNSAIQPLTGICEMVSSSEHGRLTLVAKHDIYAREQVLQEESSLQVVASDNGITKLPYHCRNCGIRLLVPDKIIDKLRSSKFRYGSEEGKILDDNLAVENTPSRKQGFSLDQTHSNQLSPKRDSPQTSKETSLITKDVASILESLDHINTSFTAVNSPRGTRDKLGDYQPRNVTNDIEMLDCSNITSPEDARPLFNSPNTSNDIEISSISACPSVSRLSSPYLSESSSDEGPTPPPHRMSVKNDVQICHRCHRTLYCSSSCRDIYQSEVGYKLGCSDVEDIIRESIPALSSELANHMPGHIPAAVQHIHLLMLVRILAMASTMDRHPLDIDEIKFLDGDLSPRAPIADTWRPQQQGQSRPRSWSQGLSSSNGMPWTYKTKVVLSLQLLREIDVIPELQLERYEGWVLNTLWAKIVHSTKITRGWRAIAVYNETGQQVNGGGKDLLESLNLGTSESPSLCDGDLKGEDVWIGSLLPISSYIREADLSKGERPNVMVDEIGAQTLFAIPTANSVDDCSSMEVDEDVDYEKPCIKAGDEILRPRYQNEWKDCFEWKE